MVKNQNFRGNSENKINSFWNLPWGFRQTSVLISGICLTGFLLEIAFNGKGVLIPEFPLNVFFFLILFLICLGLFFLKSAPAQVLIEWISSTPTAILSIAALSLLGSIAAIFPQNTKTPITHSWPFVLIYLLVFISLTVAVLKRLNRINFKNVVFILNHLGLIFVMVSGALSAGDLKRYKMTLNQNQTVWQAITDREALIEMPFALQLNKFSIQEFPSEVIVEENTKLRFTPVIEGGPTESSGYRYSKPFFIDDWEISATDYWPFGIEFGGKINRIDHFGSTPVMFLRAKNKNTGQIVEQDIHGASSMMESKHLLLPGIDSEESLQDDKKTIKKKTFRTLRLLPAAAKLYSSQLSYFTKSGRKGEFTLEVNKPLNLEGWDVYQISFDEAAGRHSQISIVEVIKDPWLPLTYLGLTFMLLGAILFFLMEDKKTQIKSREENSHD